MSAFMPSLSAAESAIVHEFIDQCIEPFEKSLAQIQSELSADAVPVRGDVYHERVAAAFEQSQQACREFDASNGNNPAVMAVAKKLFLERTAPWFDQSWIAHRSRSKPSGFPGDYEMLIKLYQQVTPACGVGGYIDLCIQDLPLAQAVRARLADARKFLIEAIGSRNGEVRVLDIASGPGREFEGWPAAKQDSTVEIVAMDSDKLALEHVRTHVASKMPPGNHLRPVRHNALRTRSSKNTIAQFGRFDLIYSVGLCDYLTDDHLVGLLSAWRETLEEGGILYVAFKDTERYDHTPYQWHLDWYFYQRTHPDVLKLYRAAGFDDQALDISKDATGIITNYVYHDGGSKIVRIDAAQSAKPQLADVRFKSSNFENSFSAEAAELN